MKRGFVVSEEEQSKKKNWFIKHKILTVIGVLLLIAIVTSASGSKNNIATKVGDDNSGTSAKEQTVFKVGDVISFDNKKVIVTAAERNWSSGNQFIMPSSGNEYVKVQVTIQNNSDDQISYNTFDWKIQDSKGVIQSAAGVTYTVDGALNSGELTKNGEKSGFVVFEVPSGDLGLVLQYNPSFWTDKKLEIKI